jgi:bifunctional DNase/RNase
MKRIPITLGLFALGCAAPAPPPPPPPPKPVAPPEPTEPTGLPAGYVEMTADRVFSVGDGEAALLLVDPQGDVVPIFIGGTEAVSIDTRLRHEIPVRPLTHDLLDHVLDSLHAKLVQVQIDEVRDSVGGGIYIGSIYLRVKGRVFKLDARPSDAVALAIGDHVPIYVAGSVIEAARPIWDDLKRQLPATGESG